MSKRHTHIRIFEAIRQNIIPFAYAYGTKEKLNIKKKRPFWTALDGNSIPIVDAF